MNSSFIELFFKILNVALNKKNIVLSIILIATLFGLLFSFYDSKKIVDVATIHTRVVTTETLDASFFHINKYLSLSNFKEVAGILNVSEADCKNLKKIEFTKVDKVNQQVKYNGEIVLLKVFYKNESNEAASKAILDYLANIKVLKEEFISEEKRLKSLDTYYSQEAEHLHTVMAKYYQNIEQNNVDLKFDLGNLIEAINGIESASLTVKKSLDDLHPIDILSKFRTAQISTAKRYYILGGFLVGVLLAISFVLLLEMKILLAKFNSQNA